MTSGAGRVLGGRYTLLTPIAQGGMGEVWKARDRVSGHIVAAKVLRPELAGEELSLSRLRLEARNSMSISHPNIANTQDSGQEDGIGWIIMELVDGYPLTDYLRGGSRIEPEYLMPILVQVAMALGAAARAGVVHRDIKPANILVRPDGNAGNAGDTDERIVKVTARVSADIAGRCRAAYIDGVLEGGPASFEAWIVEAMTAALARAEKKRGRRYEPLAADRIPKGRR